jgi:hypothetical protein
MPKLRDLTGQKFGMLTALSHFVKNKRTYWQCRCDCGKVVTKLLDDVVNGYTCGCISKLTTHGMTKTVEHRTWEGMIRRCRGLQPDSKRNYFDRGIRVCDEWVRSFSQFYADMGPRPSANHSLDRIDNDKGYYKENCRWATKKEQARNQRRNVFLTYKGKTKTVSAWAEELNLTSAALRSRKLKGWTDDEVLRTPKWWQIPVSSLTDK